MSLRRQRSRALYLAGFAAASMLTTRALGLPRVWDGSASQVWNTAANWAPAGVPVAVDDLTIQLDTANVTFTANGNANTLLMSDGAVLSTSGFTLTVADRITLTENSASGVRLTVANAALGLVTNFIDIQTGADMVVLGGARVQRVLDIDSTSALFVSDTILFTGTSGVVFNNNGTVSVQSGPAILRATSGGTLNLDGGGAGVISVISGNRTLLVDGPLTDSLSSSLTIGDENIVTFTRSWGADAGSSLNMSGGTSLALAAVLAAPATALATISGDLFFTNHARLATPAKFTNTSNITGVGTLYFEGPTTIGGGTNSGGTWIQQGNFTIASDTIFQGALFWDCDNGATTTINPGVTLTLQGGAGLATMRGLWQINSGEMLFNTGGAFTVGSGAGTNQGRIHLNQTTNIASIINASVITMDGALEVTGAGRVVSNITFGPTSSSTINNSSLLQFEGTVTYNGGTHGGAGAATFLGGPLEPINVNSSTTISYGQINWDGTADNTPTNISMGAHFTINAASVDFDGPAGTYGSTITMNTQGTMTVNVPGPWRFAGNMNLQNRDNVAGSQIISTGAIRVTNNATILAPIHFSNAASVTVNGTNTTLTLAGAITYQGGSYTGTGTINQNGNAAVIGNTTIAVGTYNFDGLGASVTTINPGAQLTLSVGNIDSADDVFGGTVNINSGTLNVNNIANLWTMAGTLNLNNAGGLPLVSGDKMLVTGNVSVTNTATIMAAIAYTSSANVVVGSGALQMFGASEYSGGTYAGPGNLSTIGAMSVLSNTTINTSLLQLLSGASLNIAAGATLDMRGILLISNNGLFGGPGTLDANGGLSILENATLSFAKMDWDGSLSNNSTTSLSAGKTLMLNAGQLDAVGDGFNGTINLNGGTLIVNNSANQWELTGTMNMSGLGTNNSTVGGEQMRLTGLIFNNLGTATISAPMRYSGGTFDVGNGARIDVNSALVSVGAQTLTKVGLGTLSINNVQTHGINSTINATRGTVFFGTNPGAAANRPLNVNVGDGTNAATVVFNPKSHLKSLHVKNGVAEINQLLATDSLQVDAGAGVDVKAGALLANYSGTNSPLLSIKGLLGSGYAGGAWNGAGIRSSVAAGDANKGVGYGEASAVLGISGTSTANFLGETVDATTVLVRYTIDGDANLNGGVDFADLLTVAANFGINDGSATWNIGDFTFDGNIGFVDLLTVSANFGQALPAAIPGASAEFNEALAAVAAQVPEPWAAGMVGIAIIAMRRRRRGK